MITALKSLFVEPAAHSAACIRVAPEPRRVLIVDATGHALAARVASATERVAADDSRRVTFVPVALANDRRVGSVNPALIWLFVDSQSDCAYCGLVAQELARRFAVAPRIASFGACEGLRVDCELDSFGSRAGVRGRGARAERAAGRLIECEGQA